MAVSKWDGQLAGVKWSGEDDQRWDTYLQNYTDLQKEAQRWMGDTSNTHWANYVRQREGMFSDFQQNTDFGLPTGSSMWDYGYTHAQKHGYKTNRENWKVLGSGDMPRNQMAIGDSIDDWAKWHWENYGQAEGRTTGSKDPAPPPTSYQTGDIGDVNEDFDIDYGDPGSDIAFNYEDIASDVMGSIEDWASNYDFDSKLNLDDPYSDINQAISGGFDEFISNYRPDLNMADIKGFEEYAKRDDLGKFQTEADIKALAYDEGWLSGEGITKAIQGSGFQSATDVESAISDATSSYLSDEQIQNMIGDQGFQTAEQIQATMDQQGFAKSDSVTANTLKLAGVEQGVGAISDFIGENLAGYEGGLENLIRNTKSNLTNTFSTDISEAVGKLQQDLSGDISTIEGKVDTTMSNVATDLGTLTGDMGEYISSGAKHQADVLKIQQDMAEKALRIRSATSVGVGGAASFRGSRESLKGRGKARKGVKQFNRNTQAFKSQLKI